MKFTFVHAADVHLDSPLRGLERYEGAPVAEVRGATRRALTGIVDLAIEREAAFVLIVGDLYDGDWRDYRSGLFFHREMVRLRQHAIDVYLVQGNHDAESQISKRLRLPENVHIFPTGEPTTIRNEHFGVAVHGQSYARRAVLEDLSLGYPAPAPGFVNIGLLHTSASGREGHEPYAPCRPEALAAKGYDYWALGHVHQREVLTEDPWVVFPGNCQGRHMREPGAKGCTLVTVGDGRLVAVEHQSLDIVRWGQIEVDASGAEDGEAVLDRLRGPVAEAVDGAEGRTLCARIHITGRCPAHRELMSSGERWRNEVRALVTDVSSGRGWVERIAIDTGDTGGSRGEGDANDGDLAALMLGLEGETDAAALAGELAGEVADLKRKLPQCFEEADGAVPGSEEWVRAALAQVKELVRGRLLGVPNGEGESR